LILLCLQQTQTRLFYIVFVYEKSKIIIGFVLVFAVFTQFLSFLGFVKVFCFGKM